MFGRKRKSSQRARPGRYLSGGEFVLGPTDWSNYIVEDLRGTRGLWQDYYESLLPDPEPHKCASCGSTETAGSRCSYCRQLVAA